MKMGTLTIIPKAESQVVGVEKIGTAAAVPTTVIENSD
jgi:hypothetical protein